MGDQSANLVDLNSAPPGIQSSDEDDEDHPNISSPNDQEAADTKTSAKPRLGFEETAVEEKQEEEEEDAQQLTVSTAELSEDNNNGEEEGGESSANLGGGQGFVAGDLVWAKVKYHPWWPGQVFDAMYASEEALKRRRRGTGKGKNSSSSKIRDSSSLLVANFGDGSFSWCSRSALKPLAEGAHHVAEARTAALAIAVEQALGELQRRIELGLACNCVRRQRPGPVINAGVRAGVFVHKHSDSTDALARFKAPVLLEQLRELAWSPRFEDAVQIAVVSAHLSAFNASRRNAAPAKISADVLLKHSRAFRDSSSLLSSPREEEVRERRSCKGSRRIMQKKKKKRNSAQQNAEIAASEEEEEEEEEEKEKDQDEVNKKRKAAQQDAEIVSSSQEEEEEGDQKKKKKQEDGGIPEKSETKEKKKKISKRPAPKRPRKDYFLAKFTLSSTPRNQKKPDTVSASSSSAKNAGVDSSIKKNTPMVSKLGACISKVAGQIIGSSPLSPRIVSPPLSPRRPAPTEITSEAKVEPTEITSEAKADVGCSGSQPSNEKKHDSDELEDIRSCSSKELFLELSLVARDPTNWKQRKRMFSRVTNAFLRFRDLAVQKKHEQCRDNGEPKISRAAKRENEDPSQGESVTKKRKNAAACRAASDDKSKENSLTGTSPEMNNTDEIMNRHAHDQIPTNSGEELNPNTGDLIAKTNADKTRRKSKMVQDLIPCPAKRA